MALVDIRVGHKTTAFFAANPTLVLKDGQLMVVSDGANQGKYKIGDGTTQLSALTFYGGVSSSGLTIGTTTITSGTTTRILYNNAGVVGEYLVTGTGTTAVLSTSPTFTTDITTPLIIGGTAVGSTLSYKGTSGNGTSTVAAHQFLVGNNGATTAFSIYNSGNFNIGNKNNTTPRILRVGQDTAWWDFGSWVGSTTDAAIYGCTTTPGLTNYALSVGSNGYTYLNSADGTNLQLRINNSVRFRIKGIEGNNASTAFEFFCPAMTVQTLSTNIPSFKVNGSTTQKATGADSLQYYNWFTSNTSSYVGASTLTLGANFVAEYMQGGTNSTITTSAAIYVPTLALTNTTTGIGLFVNAPSGAGTNYAARFNGVTDFLGNVRLTQTVTNEVVASDTTVTVVINGTTYKLLARA